MGNKGRLDQRISGDGKKGMKSEVWRDLQQIQRVLLPLMWNHFQPPGTGRAQGGGALEGPVLIALATGEFGQCAVSGSQISWSTMAAAAAKRLC